MQGKRRRNLPSQLCDFAQRSSTHNHHYNNNNYHYNNNYYHYNNNYHHYNNNYYNYSKNHSLSTQ